MAGATGSGSVQTRLRRAFALREEAMKRLFTILARLSVVGTLLWAPGAASSDTGFDAISAAASCAQADVQAALDVAADGDTVLVPAGDCTWADPVRLSNAKGVSLICATTGGCAITSAGTAILFDTLSGVNDKLYRISGFRFINTIGSFIIWFMGDGTLSRIRVDHNRFETGADSQAVFFGHTLGVANYYGVVDHNTLASSGSASLLTIIGATNPAPPPSQAGTAQNLFVEDNTILIAAMTNAGRGCMDSWGNGAIVWRHNSSLNCLVTSHGVTHSGGPQNLELYENVLAVDAGADPSFEDGYRLFHHQGSGELTVFNNTFTAYSGHTGDPLELTHYRSADPVVAGYDPDLGRCDGTNPLDGNRAPQSTYFGYPCWRQPGRDFAGNLKPIYVWNNRWSDTGVLIELLVANPWGQTAPAVEDHIQAERDYYNAVSASLQTSPAAPFDGSHGMGFGLLANRPTTCTTNALEAGGGVGYFATDQATLYRCAATNVWVAHYTPYAYPHPLTAGDGLTVKTYLPTLAR